MKSAKPAPAGSPFQVLRDLKGHLEPAKQAKAAPAAAPAPSATPAPPMSAAGDEDAVLLAQAFAGAKPLARDNHARLDKPKPAPKPRPKLQEETESSAAPRPQWIDPNDPLALFRASVGEVTPVKDTGRAEVGPRLSRQKRQAQAAAPAAEATPELYIPDLPGDDPAALFRRAAGPVTPLADKNQAALNKPLPAARPRPREEVEVPAATPAPAHPPLSDRADTAAEGEHLRPGAPGRLLADLRRGRIPVETEIDLHGYTRDEARDFLSAALARCGRRGQRCLRVIHGKGLSSPGGESLLKNLTRNWLAQHPEVLAFCEAKPADGGSGALLVLLHNPRREGATADDSRG
jgi:DNA-nicking Smr family endonuclease